MCKTIAVSNLKGGVGKTMTAASLSVGLARKGKRTLVVDCDSQHSLTVSFGVSEPDKLKNTLASAIMDVIKEDEYEPMAGIIRHTEGVDLLPANRGLTGVEIALVQATMRETILRRHVERLKPSYDYIIFDCAPTFGLLTVNVLSAVDSIIIPVCPKFLDAKGMELLLQSIAKIRRQVNHTLAIEGIILTMVDRRAKLTRDVVASIESAYGGNIRIFSENVPRSVRAAETSGLGVSIFAHDPKGQVAAAYAALVEGVLCCG